MYVRSWGRGVYMTPWGPWRNLIMVPGLAFWEAGIGWFAFTGGPQRRPTDDTLDEKQGQRLKCVCACDCVCDGCGRHGLCWASACGCVPDNKPLRPSPLCLLFIICRKHL